MTDQINGGGTSCCLLLHTLEYWRLPRTKCQENKRKIRGQLASYLSLECKNNFSSLHMLSHPPPAHRLKSDFIMFTRAPGLISITVAVRAHGKDYGFHDLTDSGKH